MDEEKKLKTFRQLFGDQIVDGFFNYIRSVEDAADANGIQYKEVAAEPPTDTETETTTETEATTEDTTETPEDSGKTYVGDLTVEDFVKIVYQCVMTAMQDMTQEETQKETSLRSEQLANLERQLKEVKDVVNELNSEVPRGILRRVATSGVRPSSSGKVAEKDSNLKNATKEEVVSAFLSSLGLQ